MLEDENWNNGFMARHYKLEAKHKLLVNRVKTVIGNILLSVETPDDIKAIIKNKVFLQDLKGKEASVAAINMSSAREQNTESRLIRVVSLYSVWIDCILKDKPTRININPVTGKYSLTQLSPYTRLRKNVFYRWKKLDALA